MTHSEWKQSNSLPSEFSAILNGPTFTLALRVMESEALQPRRLPPGAAATDYVAERERREGWLEAIRFMRNLANPTMKAPIPIEADFGAEDILREDGHVPIRKVPPNA